MKIAVAGANGFIGKALVQSLLEAGHEVVAITRKKSNGESKFNLTEIECDLSKSELPATTLSRIDVFINLITAMHGDLFTRLQQTRTVTENVLNTVASNAIPCFMHVSSISILDYESTTANTQIDKHTALSTKTNNLGIYARVKLEQEIQVKQWQLNSHIKTIIVRPGLVYYQGHISDAHAGFVKKSLGICAVHKGQVPLVNITQCCKLMTKLCERTPELSNLSLYHLLDSHLPTQSAYLKLLVEQGTIKWYIYLDWKNYRRLAYLMHRLLAAIGLKRKTPDALLPASVHARLKPYQFIGTDVFAG